MLDVIEQLREEAFNCLKVSKQTDPDMARHWSERADKFTRAADYIESKELECRRAAAFEQIDQKEPELD